MTATAPRVALGLLFLVAGCGGRTEVHVIVTGRASDVFDRLEVVAKLPDRTSKTIEIPRTIQLPTDFSLRFDPSVSGRLTVEVTGVTAAQRRTASGMTDLISGQMATVQIAFDGAVPDGGPNFDAFPEAGYADESDCLDGIDNNGDGRTDCQDPSCTTVTCTSDVALGSEIGEVATPSVACSPGFLTGHTYHQAGAIPPTCSCTCTASITCSTTLSYHTGDPQCGAPATLAANVSLNSFPGANKTVCFDLAAWPSNLQSFSVGPITRSGSTVAVVTNDPPHPTPVTDNQVVFCPSARSHTCPKSSDVCVRKPARQMCARIPGENVACPAGYSAAPPGRYYEQLVEGRTCGSCGAATVTSDGTCGAAIKTLSFSAYSCQGVIPDNDLQNLFVGAVVAPACGASGNMTAFWNRLNQSVYIYGLGNDATCTATAPATGTVTGQSGSTICCNQ